MQCILSNLVQRQYDGIRLSSRAKYKNIYFLIYLIGIQLKA